MMTIIILLGIIIGAVAVVLLIKPEVCFEFGGKYFLSSKFQYGMGIFRLFLAMTFYFLASVSKFPIFFGVVALFMLVRGVTCLVLPAADFRDLVSWALRVFSPYGRFVGVCFAFVGGFLIYTAT